MGKVDRKIVQSSRNGNVFLMIKPWAMQFGPQIKSVYNGTAECLLEANIVSIPLDLISRQYEEHRAKPFFWPMVLDHQGKPAFIAVYYGSMHVMLALKLGLREAFDSFIPQEVQGHRRDAIHMSVNRAEFNHDFNVWRSYFKNSGGNSDSSLRILQI